MSDDIDVEDRVLRIHLALLALAGIICKIAPDQKPAVIQVMKAAFEEDVSAAVALYSKPKGQA